MTRQLVVKSVLAAAGFVAGLAGMALELRVLVWIGVGLLAGAFVLRFAQRGEPSPRGDG